VPVEAGAGDAAITGAARAMRSEALRNEIVSLEVKENVLFMR
jgi:hypothetical protein